MNQIAVLGTGLLGSSLALALKQRGFAGRITGLARRASSAEAALRTGGYDLCSTEPGEALRGADLVVVAVPLSGFESAFETISSFEHAGMTITDVGSTKASAQAAADARLENPKRFVGSHPMAGNEKQGPDAADAELFTGKPCIVCAAIDAEPASVQRVHELWAALRMSLLTMTPEEHDRQVAATSHLPHAAAVTLVQTAQHLAGFDTASTGFGDTTRLASSNPAMRRDIMMANADALALALRRYASRLASLADQLEAGDEPGLLQGLEQAKALRDAWTQSHTHRKEAEQ